MNSIFVFRTVNASFFAVLANHIPFFSDFVYSQINKERSSSSSTNPLAVNTLNFKIDLHLISPYSITPEENKGHANKENVINLRNLDNKLSLSN